MCMHKCPLSTVYQMQDIHLHVYMYMHVEMYQVPLESRVTFMVRMFDVHLVVCQ